MYTKEQIATRLKLGTSLTNAELALIIKSMNEVIDKLQEEVDQLKDINNAQLSKNRREFNTATGETISTTSVQSGFKL